MSETHTDDPKSLFAHEPIGKHGSDVVILPNTADPPLDGRTDRSVLAVNGAFVAMWSVGTSCGISRKADCNGVLMPVAQKWSEADQSQGQAPGRMGSKAGRLDGNEVEVSYITLGAEQTPDFGFNTVVGITENSTGKTVTYYIYPNSAIYTDTPERPRRRSVADWGRRILKSTGVHQPKNHSGSVHLVERGAATKLADQLREFFEPEV